MDSSQTDSYLNHFLIVVLIFGSSFLFTKLDPGNKLRKEKLAIDLNLITEFSEQRMKHKFQRESIKSLSDVKCENMLQTGHWNYFKFYPEKDSGIENKFDGIFTPNLCDLLTYESTITNKCLENKTAIFFGDSKTRQLSIAFYNILHNKTVMNDERIQDNILRRLIEILFDSPSEWPREVTSYPNGECYPRGYPHDRSFLFVPSFAQFTPFQF